MATTSRIQKITTSADVNGEVGSFRNLSLGELVTIILYEGKPLTVWEVAAKLGDGYDEQASTILDALTARGTLARFRAGFSYYYALPRVALTGQEPTLRAIMSDSLNSLFLTCQYKVMKKLKGTNKCFRAK